MKNMRAEVLPSFVEDLVIPAVRYAMTRRTYITATVIDAVKACFPSLSVKTLSVLGRDVRENVYENPEDFCQQTTEAFNKTAWEGFLDSVDNELEGRGFVYNPEIKIYEEIK